jgi:hypothetical protein
MEERVCGICSVLHEVQYMKQWPFPPYYNLVSKLCKECYKKTNDFNVKTMAASCRRVTTDQGAMWP